MHVLEGSAQQPTRIRFRKPSDMHHHFRQGEVLAMVAPLVARRFAYAVSMPNTDPPITTPLQLSNYSQEIRKHGAFTPLMTYYLTDMLSAVDVENTWGVCGVKYYPRGLTTNSEHGVQDPASLWTRGTSVFDVLRVLADCRKVLLLHAADGFDAQGEELDPYDQEPHFITQTLPRIIDAHPDLKISVEHLSTTTGVKFLRENGGKKLGCSLTPQHLLLDRRDAFRGGFRPHTFCWPIIQPKEHRDELRKLVCEGHSFVWLGSDSAPHAQQRKESACCSGGVFTAHAGVELYLQAFEDMRALELFEDFASCNGPRFFGYPLPQSTIEFEVNPWTVMDSFYYTNENLREDRVVPHGLGGKMRWKLVQ